MMRLLAFMPCTASPMTRLPPLPTVMVLSPVVPKAIAEPKVAVPVNAVVSMLVSDTAPAALLIVPPAVSVNAPTLRVAPLSARVPVSFKVSAVMFTTPPLVRDVPSAISIVPEPLKSRPAPRLMPAVVASVPPPKTMSFAALPRLPSLEMESPPAVRVMPPVKLLAPARVTVPDPALLKEPVPLSAPA